MSSTELEDKLADYAFGNMSGSEREAFAAALANDPELRAEYETIWQPMVATLPLAVMQVELPPAMRQRVLAAAVPAEPVAVAQRSAQAGGTPVAPQLQAAIAVPNTRPTPAVAVAPRSAQAGGTFAPTSFWRKLVVLFSRPQVAFGGLAIMLIISLASVTWAFTLNAQHEADMAHIVHEQAEIDALLADGNARMISLQPTDNWKAGSGKAVYDPSQNAVYITMSGPPPTDNVDCQLWGMKNGQATSLAVFHMNGQLVSHMAHAPADLSSYTELMITWEQPGGAAQPSKWIMLEAPVQNN